MLADAGRCPSDRRRLQFVGRHLTISEQTVVIIRKQKVSRRTLRGGARVGRCAVLSIQRAIVDSRLKNSVKIDKFELIFGETFEHCGDGRRRRVCGAAATNAKGTAAAGAQRVPRTNR